MTTHPSTVPAPAGRSDTGGEATPVVTRLDGVDRVAVAGRVPPATLIALSWVTVGGGTADLLEAA